jgi:hypothetical protein
MRAAADKRSMTKEIIYLLEVALTGLNEEDRERQLQEAESQAEAWLRLAGQWDSEQTAEDEIKAIYESRTRGRQVDL